MHCALLARTWDTAIESSLSHLRFSSSCQTRATHSRLPLLPNRCFIAFRPGLPLECARYSSKSREVYDMGQSVRPCHDRWQRSQKEMTTKDTLSGGCKGSVLDLRDLPFEYRRRGSELGKPRWDNTRALGFRDRGLANCDGTIHERWDSVPADVSSSELSIALPLCPILPA